MYFIENLSSPYVVSFLVAALFSAIVFLLNKNYSFDISSSQIFKVVFIFVSLSLGFRAGTGFSAGNVQVTSFWDSLFILSIVTTFGIVFSYLILKRVKKFDEKDALLLASTFGSSSIITFGLAVIFLDTQGFFFSAQNIILVAIFEIPIVLFTYFFVKVGFKSKNVKIKDLRLAISNCLVNGSSVYLLAGFLIAYVPGNESFEQIQYLFISPFEFSFTIFYALIGIWFSNLLIKQEGLSFKLISFSIFTPVISALLVLLISSYFTPYYVDIFLLMVIASSSSIFAVPVASKFLLQKANLTNALFASSVIAFPLNIALIPVYFHFAEKVLIDKLSLIGF